MGSGMEDGGRGSGMEDGGGRLTGASIVASTVVSSGHGKLSETTRGLDRCIS